MFDLDEIEQFEMWHPRAVKLFRKRKNFIVIAEDEPYFAEAYKMIRTHEIEIGRWSEEDEQAYQSAQQSVQSDALIVGANCPDCGCGFRDPHKPDCKYARR